MRKFDAEIVKAEINRHSLASKIYFGSDSYRFKKDGIWYARYTTVTVIHKDGNKGCSVFGRIDTAVDYDARKDRPVMRMMNEAYRVADMYNEIADAIGDRHVEIHIDINPDEKHGSNVALSGAKGYIVSATGVMPKNKPGALAASFCADRFRAYEKEKEAA